MPHRADSRPFPPITISDDPSRVDLGQLAELFDITWWAKDRPPDQVRRALEHSHPVLTAWEGERMVGFTRVISDRTYRATIWDVIVRPSHQGQKIGAAMIDRTLEELRRQGALPGSFVGLFTGRPGFYEKVGFSRSGGMSRGL